MEPLLVDIEDAARILGVRRTTAYGLIKDGAITKVNVGRRALVTTASLREYVERQAAAQAEDAEAAAR